MIIGNFNILNSHIGYGNSMPEIIFVGLEEYCEPATMVHNYSYRIGNIAHSLMSLQGFHLGSGLPSLTRWFTPPAYPIQSTWNLYCQVVLSYLGIPTIK